MLRTRRRKLRVYWENPPRATVYIERETANGRIEERRGPRSLLTIEEAAVALQRSSDDVLQAIHSGFLRAQRRGAKLFVTPQACRRFLDEEAEDRALALARRRGKKDRRLSWEETFKAMAHEREDWSDLDATLSAGLDKEPW